LRDCGVPIEVLDGPPGLAATRKLLRSVFYKGMAGAVVEALQAARSAGCEDWLREHISEELAAADANTLSRLEHGSYKHALRRSHEMAAAAELLAELGVPPRITRASQLWLEDLANQRGGAP
jgi:3-hydroxyisobutyrate dehydrogenase-like beta-hydroxyacid dehydrogenase